jgi:hypothetical protein
MFYIYHKNICVKSSIHAAVKRTLRVIGRPDLTGAANKSSARVRARKMNSLYTLHLLTLFIIHTFSHVNMSESLLNASAFQCTYILISQIKYYTLYDWYHFWCKWDVLISWPHVTNLQCGVIQSLLRFKKYPCLLNHLPHPQAHHFLYLCASDLDVASVFEHERERFSSASL